jgi:formylglycine-generating enzyme
MSKRKYIYYLLGMMAITGCSSGTAETKTHDADSMVACASNLPARMSVPATDTIIRMGNSTTEGMVHITGGEYQMGAADKEGRPDEYPQHKVHIKDFWIDVTEVTNAQFRKFAEATGYITTAEKKVDWDELKKQLPAGTPRPPDSELEPSSLVFTPSSHPVALNNAAQWWQWTKAADWKHPQGPQSNIDGKDN